MKKNLKYMMLILVVAMIFAGFKHYEGNQKRESVINSIVYDALLSAHFKPKTVDDQLSADVFAKYVESLDYGKRYLTQDDLKTLKDFEKKLDDQFMNNEMEFFDLSYQILQGRINESKPYFEEWLSKPFDYSIDEDLETDSEKLEYAKNGKELKEYWRKYLKYRVISRVHDRMKDNDSISFEEAEIKAREKEMEFQEDLFEYMQEIERIEWLGIYLNAFANVFDPHSEYFAPKIKDRWEEEMTGQFEGIGAQLRVKGEFVTVERIIVGSASWRQNELKAGDKIIAVGQGDEEPVDVVGMKLNSVVKLIRGKKGTIVRLTVKKKDGTKVIIPIERDIVELEGTFAKSAVLGSDKKVGYIRLPKFYVDFYSKENHNAAEDVKKEIKNLSSENIEGLILDLRNNGGGSLKAAIDIAGLFIEEGPVVQVKNSFGKIRVHKDRDPKVYYDGPLVIMVNDFSASASEILAAALQDYERAIIVGSKSTYGKGTVQNIFDMDKAAGSNYADVKPLGAIKVTTEKFYRINGGTTQLNGVTPDIILPDVYNNLDMGEKEEEFALAFDEIEPAYYQKWEESAFSKEMVVNESMQRIQSNLKFNTTLKYADWLKENEDDTRVSLNYSQYDSDQVDYEAELDSFELDKESNDSLAVGYLDVQRTWFETDTSKREEYRRWHKNLSKDVYLLETVNVIYDLGNNIAVTKSNEK